MKLYLCDEDDCAVLLFTESDAGSARCPSCGFLGGLTREATTDRGGTLRFLSRFLGRPVASAVPR